MKYSSYLGLYLYAQQSQTEEALREQGLENLEKQHKLALNMLIISKSVGQ